jgi:four helix bundle protein
MDCTDDAGMSRDHRQRPAFPLADALVVAVYRLTSAMPADERFGLQSQIRRAAVSVATSLVEGVVRPAPAEYCRALRAAHAAARESEYLLGLASRLQMIDATSAAATSDDFRSLAGMLLVALADVERQAGELSARARPLRRALPSTGSARS